MLVLKQKKKGRFKAYDDKKMTDKMLAIEEAMIANGKYAIPASFTCDQLLEMLHFDPGSRANQVRMGRSAKELGWKNDKISVGKSQRKVYYPPIVKTKYVNIRNWDMETPKRLAAREKQIAKLRKQLTAR